MGDYRERSFYNGYLYLKSEPQSKKKIFRGMRKRLSAKEKEDLITKLKEETGVPSIKGVERITLDFGRVYISDGNLVLDNQK